MWEKDNKQEQGQYFIHSASFTVWLDFFFSFQFSNAETIWRPILIHKPSLLQQKSKLRYF